jgi:hypothetical protein
MAQRKPAEPKPSESRDRRSAGGDASNFLEILRDFVESERLVAFHSWSKFFLNL